MHGSQSIGQLLKRAREDAGMSLRQLAEQCAENGAPISFSALAMIERGEREPLAKTLRILSRVLDGFTVYVGSPDELNTRAMAARALAREASERGEDVRSAHSRAFEMPIEEAQVLADQRPKSPVAAAGVGPVAPTRAEQDYLAGRLGPASAESTATGHTRT